jgi:DNA-binding LacI/PurR family transcriptional regulator
MSKRAKSVDVARAAGVSRTTVSLVLNNVPGIRISESTRERVTETASRMNYHPDISGRKLASGKSFTLGLVLRQNPEQIYADAFLLQVILGVERAAGQMGFRVLLKPIEPGKPSGYEELIHENHVDGIILSGPRQDDIEIIRIHREGFPVVLMGQLPGYDIPYVDIDAISGAKIATRHLIDHGHRRIAMLTNAPLAYTSAQQRLEGYQQALTEMGIEPEASLLREGNFVPASGYEAMADLLEVSPRPTAVFVASDIVAMGAMQAIKRAGLNIPKDVAVVGFDDIPLAEFYDPPLTTVCLPAYGLGWAAGERLSRLVRGDSLDQSGLLLNTALILRESSARNAR